MSRTYTSRVAQLLEQHKMTEQQANMNEQPAWCPISDDLIRQLFPRQVAAQGIDKVAEQLTERDIIDLHREVIKKLLAKKKSTLKYLEDNGAGNRMQAQQLREEIKQLEEQEAKQETH